MGLQSGHPTAQDGKELMVGRRRGLLKRPDAREALDQTYLKDP